MSTVTLLSGLSKKLTDGHQFVTESVLGIIIEKILLGKKMGKKKIRVGTLISGGGTNLQAIIDAAKSSTIDAEIVFTGSDNPSAKGLLRAANEGIPTFVTDYRAIIAAYKKKPGTNILPKDFDINAVMAKQRLLENNRSSDDIRSFLCSRAMAEADLLRNMAAYPIDLLVLAGFLRTLTPFFIDQVSPNPDTPTIMNIHPALLPSFPGTDGYRDTFNYGCKIGGATVHFIDYGEDSGPIIGQRSFPIDPDDTLETVKKKGLKLEWELYPQCIQLFAEKRLQIIHLPSESLTSAPGGKRIVRIAPPR